PHEEGVTTYGAILTGNPSGRGCFGPSPRRSSLVYIKYTTLLAPCTKPKLRPPGMWGVGQGRQERPSPAPRPMKRQQTLALVASNIVRINSHLRHQKSAGADLFGPSLICCRAWGCFWPRPRGTR